MDPGLNLEIPGERVGLSDTSFALFWSNLLRVPIPGRALGGSLLRFVVLALSKNDGFLDGGVELGSVFSFSSSFWCWFTAQVGLETASEGLLKFILVNAEFTEPEAESFLFAWFFFQDGTFSSVFAEEFC